MLFQECPIGTFKNVEGSDKRLCTPCPPEHLPSRAKFVYVRGILSYSALIFHSLISLLIVEAVNLQEELANLFVPTNVCLTSTDYQTAIHLWKISSIHLEGHFHVLFFCVVWW